MYDRDSDGLRLHMCDSMKWHMEGITEHMKCIWTAHVTLLVMAWASSRVKGGGDGRFTCRVKNPMCLSGQQ